MNSKAKINTRRRTSTGAYAGKTKFDKWLETCQAQEAECEVVIQPPAPYPYPSGTPDDCRFRVRVLVVDRYAICLEFLNASFEDEQEEEEHDGRVWWISKDSLRAASRIS